MVSMELVHQRKLKRVAGEEIRIRIQAQIVERIDTLAAHKEMTRSEAVRYIIEIGLDAASNDA